MVRPDGRTRRSTRHNRNCSPQKSTTPALASRRVRQIEDINIIETFTEEIDIPATDLVVESTAITAELETNLGTDTDTFHEVDVDGEWRFIVFSQDIIDGTC